ncbi:MAG TPA: polysaccharide pyruvyl transferase family protein [Actinomycetota bacterium]|nr:polysaccharide pyruvyl transferase family protein [Actinomycetota bacterium]
MSASPDRGAPRIGLWGTFDLENYGDMLFPRILEEELGRRIPDAGIRVFAPVGYTGLNRFEEREPAEPLGPWSPERVSELAGELDCVVVGPGEIIHGRDELLSPHYGLAPAELRRRAPSRFFLGGLGPELESECPVLWSAVGIPFDFRAREALRVREALADRPLVTVRDEVSRRRLRKAGVEREVEVVPDPAFLSPRLFPRRLLEKRLAQLRATGLYPEKPPLVLQGNAASISHVQALAAALARLREEQEIAGVVIVETGPCHGDGEFARELAEAFPGSVRLPSGGLADVTAAIAASAGFIGTSLHGNIIALTYDRPHLVLAWGRETKLEGFAEAIDNLDCLTERAEDVPAAFEKVSALGSRTEIVTDLTRRVDAHLDRVAEVAVEAAARREVPSAGMLLRDQLEMLNRAYERRGRMLVAQRWTLADRFADLDAEIAALKQEIARLEREVAGRAGELERLLNTKTFRYTNALRRLYSGLRRRGR